MDKLLYVCLAKDLPLIDERQSDYIYFTYDDLQIYLGNADYPISSNFAIVENMPENPVPEMIYILLDGTLHQYIDYSDITIATIYSEDMIPLISKAGTTYFINSDSRYINKQTRTLTLPFNNGTYELSVNADTELKFNNNTIIRYNEETGKFEISGDYSNTSGTSGGNSNEDYEEYSKYLKGKNTNTVNTSIDGSRINASVNISQAFGNMLLAASDGLYVRSDNKVDETEFEAFKKDFKDFKSYAYAILDNVGAQLEFLEGIITREGITNEILNQLSARYDNIEYILENFDEIRARLNTIESDAMSYSVNTTNNAIEEIDSGLQTASSWEDLDEDISEYTHEVNYYDKYINWTKELSRSKNAAIISGIMQFIYDKEEPKRREKVAIASALISYINEKETEQEEKVAIASALISYINDKEIEQEEKVAIALALISYINDSESISDEEKLSIAAALVAYIKEET